MYCTAMNECYLMSQLLREILHKVYLETNLLSSKFNFTCIIMIILSTNT